MTSTQHPVLVYGTLRPGGWNYRVFLQGHTETENDIRVTGFNMYGGMKEGFPYVTRGEGTITGTLIHITPEDYDEVMKGLDFLEGYRGEGKRNHYERKLVTVQDENGEDVQAWIYVVEGATAALVASTLERTLNGDWILQCEEADKARYKVVAS